MTVFQPISQTVFMAAGQNRQITITVDGKPVETIEGTRIAAVLLSHDEQAFRHSPVSDGPRSAYCMMGVCFECLVEIDGRQNRQACLAFAREGMQVRRTIKSEARAEP